MAVKQSLSVTDISEGENSALRAFFIEALKDIYWAEKSFCKVLPRIAKKTTSSQLRELLENHLSETENQVVRLEQVFAGLDEKAESKKCEAMDGMIKEAENILSATENGSMTRDVAIIAASQKIEHYEIASYGTLRILAEVLGFNQAADLLNLTLEEEKNTDHKLNRIAENHIRESAMKGIINNGNL
ncbi:YciE/YciF ferroxidase family protein [Daejeonella oryzae]|uniref:YciE/YciF ferroxidase family protein n=1 Tax=Daejeonella oryzae TaxID=1122943 RepID=UPI0003F6A5C5|nr:ferritin-like domain-containing protein [Daejeonella oryzae]